ncbi:MAG: CoA ester lyase, partial [Rhodospirillales bacterium]
PRRSVLYMPGANTRAMEKGRTLPADVLILDLEDSVAPDSKAQARQNIVDALKEGGYGKREIVVRANTLSTPWGHDDIAAFSTCGADAILIPKVESADTVRQVEALMAAAGAPEAMAIWCMIESPRGVLHAEEIADASPRMGALVMGTADLGKELRATDTLDRIPFLTSLQLCVLAARAAGIAILDAVFFDLNDDEGFAQSCVLGKQMGFDGKTLIHPKTVAEANRAFAPSAEEIAWSKKIMEAHEQAMKEGKGIVLVDGKLTENLHVAGARRLVAMAEAIKELEAGAA